MYPGNSYTCFTLYISKPLVNSLIFSVSVVDWTNAVDVLAVRILILHFTDCTIKFFFFSDYKGMNETVSSLLQLMCFQLIFDLFLFEMLKQFIP